MKVSTLLKNDPDKDGLHLLLFRVYLNNKPFKISSGIKVPASAYKHGTITNGPSFKKGSRLNTLLQLKKSILEQAEDAARVEGVDLTSNFVKQYYISKTQEGNPKPTLPTVISSDADRRLNFFEFVDWYTDKYSKTRATNYIRQFNQPKNHIMNFRPNIRWEDFTEDFWIDYVNYLIEDKEIDGKIVLGLKNVTIQGHLKKLHTILDKAIKRKYPVPEEFMEIKYSAEEKQPFWCSWEEVELIKNAYCRTKAEEIIRDSFVISANLGIRNSDFNMINKHSIYFNKDKPMLKLVMVKTQLDYSLPINQEVWEILKKYDLSIPKYHQNTYNILIKIIARRVVEDSSFREVDYSGSKRIEKLSPRHKKFSTHTARRTFGRRWLDKGGSLIILQKIFGHRSPETTLKYIGYSSFEVEKEFAMVMES